MDIINSIITNRGMPLPEINAKDDILQAQDRLINENVTHKSDFTGFTVADSRAIAAERGTLPTATPDEVSFARQMMTGVDDLDPTLYKNLAYFAQTGNKSGFIYSCRNTRDEEIDVTFETGLFVTRERRVVDQIRFDIERAGGIGPYVQEISAKVYSDIAASAERYRALQANAGAIGSDKVDPHAMLREATARQQAEEINALRAQLRDLEKLVAADPAKMVALNTAAGQRATLTAQPSSIIDDKPVSGQAVDADGKPVPVAAKPLSILGQAAKTAAENDTLAKAADIINSRSN